ncbi:hypothetical protein WMY93_031681 [Mugilogobius chulae]|uniref:Uncharacterized protein n=1 Tax=Mugilogobius chulae TaxID=88201 RepID=A0AAW0MHW8_9GOBI
MVFVMDKLWLAQKSNNRTPLGLRSGGHSSDHPSPSVTGIATWALKSPSRTMESPAHTRSPPHTMGNPREMERPAPLEGNGSRAQAVWSEVTFHVPSARDRVHGLGRLGTSPRPPPKNTLHPSPMVLPAGGGPVGRWLDVALFGLAWPGPASGEPPLVQGWIPFLGKTLEFKRNSFGFLEDLRRKHGDVFTVLIAGRYMTFVMNPLHIPSITRLGRQLNFHEFSNTVAPYMFGYTPLHPERFHDLREKVHVLFKLLQGHHLTPLSESMMRNLLLVFREDHLEPAGSEWRTAQLYDFCLSVSLEATFMTLYGRSASRHRHQNIPKIKETSFTLCHALGVRGNTSPLMFWSVYYLLRHQEALRAVRAELQEVMSQEGLKLEPDSDLVLSREQLQKLVILDSVVNETMRLNIMSMNIRMAQEDFTLKLDSDWSIRKGDIITLCPQAIHYDPEIYQDPESFRFDRYLDDGKEKATSTKTGRRPDLKRAGLGIMQPESDVSFRTRLRRPLEHEL